MHGEAVLQFHIKWLLWLIESEISIQIQNWKKIWIRNSSTYYERVMKIINFVVSRNNGRKLRRNIEFLSRKTSRKLRKIFQDFFIRQKYKHNASYICNIKYVLFKKNRHYLAQQ